MESEIAAVLTGDSEGCIVQGDCLDVMAGMPDGCVDTIITDPPYGLSFMGKAWDHGVPGVPFWEAALRVAKPGAFLLAFGGTRTYHRLACAIEDAGWQIRDCIMWLYGSGFPKSHNISKAIDKAAGAEREVIGIKPGHEEFAGRQTKGHIDFKDGTGGFDRPWMHDDKAREAYHQLTAPSTDEAKLFDGWGTALKPAWEPIIVAMKPCDGTYANNAQAHGVAGLNIDDSRIAANGENPSEDRRAAARRSGKGGVDLHSALKARAGEPPFKKDIARYCESKPSEALGRWPANVILDEIAGGLLDQQSGESVSRQGQPRASVAPGDGYGMTHTGAEYADTGGASRFFMCCDYSQYELLLCRATAIIEAWNYDLANTVDRTSALPSEHAASALSHAVTVASHGGKRLSDVQGLSTSVTPSELRRLCEHATIAILSIGDESLPASFRIDTAPSSDSLANSAGPNAPTATTMTTPSPTSSDGCAESAISITIASNTALGAAGLRPSRFNYCSKASRSDRGKGNHHPTVKPLKLMEYLCRLTATPTGGIVLDPFAGSGSTLVAAKRTGRQYIGIELNPEYAEIAQARIKAVSQPLFV